MRTFFKNVGPLLVAFYLGHLVTKTLASRTDVPTSKPILASVTPTGETPRLEVEKASHFEYFTTAQIDTLKYMEVIVMGWIPRGKSFEGWQQDFVPSSDLGAIAGFPEKGGLLIYSCGEGAMRSYCIKTLDTN